MREIIHLKGIGRDSVATATGFHEGRKNTVWLDGRKLNPGPSLKIRNHSPDGFDWGYGGSGPAQLALAVCIELYGKTAAQKVYQYFKDEFIAGLPQTDFETEIDLRGFNDEHRGAINAVVSDHPLGDFINDGIIGTCPNCQQFVMDTQAECDNCGHQLYGPETEE